MAKWSNGWLALVVDGNKSAVADRHSPAGPSQKEQRFPQAAKPVDGEPANSEPLACKQSEALESERGPTKGGRETGAREIRIEKHNKWPPGQPEGTGEFGTQITSRQNLYVSWKCDGLVVSASC